MGSNLWDIDDLRKQRYNVNFYCQNTYIPITGSLKRKRILTGGDQTLDFLNTDGIYSTKMSIEMNMR